MGLTAGLSRKFVDTVLAHTREALKLWPRLSREFGVKKSNIQLIGRKLEAMATC